MTKRYLKTPEEVIQALKDGKKVRDAYGSICKLVDGIIISKLNDFFEIGKPIRSVNKPYILEEEEPLKIEVGKFYKTRRGDKVVCLCQQKEYYIHKLDTYVVGYWVDNTGRMLFNGKPERTETDSDVVAPWED